MEVSRTNFCSNECTTRCTWTATRWQSISRLERTQKQNDVNAVWSQGNFWLQENWKWFEVTKETAQSCV